MEGEGAGGLPAANTALALLWETLGEQCFLFALQAAREMLLFDSVAGVHRTGMYPELGNNQTD